MNDEEDVFFFVEVEAEPAFTSLSLELDANDDGKIGGPFAVDDLIAIDTVNAEARDGWRTAGIVVYDTEYGGSADVEGSEKVTPNLTRFELSHPFDSGDFGWDIDKAIGDTLGVMVWLSLNSSPDFAHTFHPGPGFGPVAQILLVPEPSRALATFAALLVLALLAAASTSTTRRGRAASVARVRGGAPRLRAPARAATPRYPPRTRAGS
jgi:hypothetical protein